jgi:hypothetical protein
MGFVVQVVSTLGAVSLAVERVVGQVRRASSPAGVRAVSGLAGCFWGAFVRAVVSLPACKRAGRVDGLDGCLRGCFPRYSVRAVSCATSPPSPLPPAARSFPVGCRSDSA